NPLNGSPSFPLPSGQGNPGGDDFAVALTVDTVSAAYPTPLVAKAPSRSLLYDPMVRAALTSVGDTDSYALALDAGQALTLGLTPGDPALAHVDVIGPDGTTVASATAPSVGAPLVIENVLVSARAPIASTPPARTGSAGIPCGCCSTPPRS